VAPKRVRLSRQKGYRIRQAVKVARPTRWGNPARVERTGSDECPGWRVTWLPSGAGVATWPDKAAAMAFAVESFTAALERDDGSLPFTRAEVRRWLRGRDLACWCALDAPCHADVLLEVANGPGTVTPERASVSG
jgi:hypothetical protein